MKQYTAKDIVKIYSELKDLTPDVKDWTVVMFKNSKPRLIRLNQLVSLKQAFKIDGNWNEFEQGKFIKNLSIEFYANLKDNIKVFKNSSSWDNQNFDNFNYSDIIKIYRLFLEFVSIELKLKNLSTIYSITYSIGQSYGFEKTKKYFNSTQNKKIDSIMNDLALILDPKNQSISKATLVKSYAFPLEHLEEIDLEFF